MASVGDVKTRRRRPKGNRNVAGRVLGSALLATLTSAAVLSAGCRCSPEEQGKEKKAVQPVLPAAVVTDPTKTGAFQKKLTDLLPNCEIEHRGTFLELGARTAKGRYGYSVLSPTSSHEVTLESSTWARVDGKSLQQVYYQDWTGPAFVQLRIRSIGSRAVVVRIDGKRLGTLRLTQDKIEVINTRETQDELEAGRHVLLLQFYRTKNKQQAKADIDWIRVARPDHIPGAYTPPLLRDIVQDKLIGGHPTRAVALHPRSKIICTVGVNGGTHLKGVIGYDGQAPGQAEIHLKEPGKTPVLLQSSKLGGEDNKPVPVDLDLTSYAGRIVHLSFETKGGPRRAKVFFGGMRMETEPLPLPQRHKAKVVLVLVLSGAARRHLPPYTPRPNLPTLTKIASQSVVFRRYRGNTSTTTGQLATLLTGLSPLTHRVADPGARLGPQFPTLASIGTSARVTSTMFTAVPTSSKLFGFDRAWSHYGYFSPVSGTSAYATWAHATQWLDQSFETAQQLPMLVLLHARGAHPPWILRRGQAGKLPPEEYTGVLTGRRAGEFFAQRRTWRPSRRHITSHDFVRSEGYVQAVLHNADEQLAHVVGVLESKKVWKDTMVIVTSDVAMGNEDHVPFDDGVRLGEDLLRQPLLIRFPEAALAGNVVKPPVSTLDLGPTILRALDLRPPKIWRGRDLYMVTVHPELYMMDQQVAVLKRRYMTTFGPYTLVGKHPRRPKLCILDTNDVCAQDLREDRPILAAFLWRSTYRRFRDAEGLFSPRPSRQPAATTNPDIISDLTVWGNMEAQ